MEKLPLKTSVTISSVTRPIRVAYIVPSGERESIHKILDAIFLESYTRWGGVFTLIIPSQENGFVDQGYMEWLQEFDPDFIYSYVDLAQNLIQKIDCLCLPIKMLKHSSSTDYTPLIGLKPVDSLSALYSVVDERSTKIPKIITQFEPAASCRFLADNFGYRHGLGNLTNTGSGYEALYYNPAILYETSHDRIHKIQSNDIESLNEVVDIISENKAITFSQLAFKNKGASSFHLGLLLHFHIFIGDTCQDRIDFWNTRHYSRQHENYPNSLILRGSDFENSALIYSIGNFLKKNAPLPVDKHSIIFRSSSLNKQQLSNFKERLCAGQNEHFYSISTIEDDYDRFPQKRESGERHIPTCSRNFRLYERENKNLKAEIPDHFKRIPSQFYNRLNTGLWAIDLEIERHNNLSLYSNVIDTWKLPRRLSAARAFTKSFSRVSKYGFLTVIPTPIDWRIGIENGPMHFELNLPSDEIFFSFLLCADILDGRKDLRNSLKKQTVSLSISDKGKKMQGVIAMFDSLNQASTYLCNKLWRDALRQNHLSNSETSGAKDKNFRPFTLKCAQGRRSTDISKHLEWIAKNVLNKPTPHSKKEKKAASKYWDCLVADSLEFLNARKIFHMTHQWTCSYCGHKNVLEIDNLKKQNRCEICSREHMLPIDQEWKFTVNNFVRETLITHSGLPVLWALAQIQEREINANSFYYLPEVTIETEQSGGIKKNEIDFLCVVDGLFCVGEVKLHAKGFMKEKEAKKFIRVINLLSPDRAYLVFEDYAKESDNRNDDKRNFNDFINKRISPELLGNIELKIIVAADDDSFGFPLMLTDHDPRSREID